MHEYPAHYESQWKFNPPPNWPVEPGFVPPEGWNPDPAWGPAPEDWAFWVPAAGAEEVDSESVETPSATQTKKRFRSKRLIGAVAAVAVVILTLGLVSQQRQQAAEELAAANGAYDSAVASLEGGIAAARDLLVDAAAADEASRKALDAEISEASELVATPVDEGDRAALVEMSEELDTAKADLDVAAHAVFTQVDLAEAISTATEAIPGAEGVLVGSEGKVNNEGFRAELTGAIESVRAHIAKGANPLSVSEREVLTTDLRTAVRSMSAAVEKVTTDQQAWQKAADEAAAEAALRDPASYTAISTRDWQLVARDPAAHEGKMYAIYGRVTQFDSNTGENLFRADTDGQKQSRWYNYDINTMVLGSRDVLANVVQGDLVKLYVVVKGPYSYETTMGANLTVPMVTANMIEVYGSD